MKLEDPGIIRGLLFSGHVAHVRFGSIADMATNPRDVRFTPDNGHPVDRPAMSVKCHKQTFVTLDNIDNTLS